jgi:hypothetical protein
MNFYSQLPELHHLTCRSLWDLTWVTFVYRWISPCSTSSTLTIRSVPTCCTALGGFFAPGMGSTQWRRLPHPTDLWGEGVWAVWRSPLQSDCYCSATLRPRRLVWLELYLLGIYHSRVRGVSCPQSTDRLLWPQPHRGSSFSVWTVSCCESSRPSMVGPFGPPTGATDPSRAVGCYSDACPLSERGLHTSGAAL